MSLDVSRPLPRGTFFGRSTALRRCDAVLSEVRHDRARICEEHVHEAAYFSLLLDGRYRETSGAITVDVTGLRIQRACRALSETQDTLASIASETGFTDQSHFTRTFKQIVGTTPAHYRRLHAAHTNGAARSDERI